jgi:hypothetical protein
MKVHRLVAPILLFGVAAVLSSCFNLGRFSDQVAANDFEAARAVLVEEKAFGIYVPLDTNEKLIKARDVYRRGVEVDALKRRDSWLKKGMPKSAAAAVEHALELCPWADNLSASLSELRRTIERLDRLDALWSTRGALTTLDQAAELLAVSKDLRRLTWEHPTLRKHLQEADSIAMRDAVQMITDLTANPDRITGCLERLKALTLDDDLPSQLAMTVDMAKTCTTQTQPAVFNAWSDTNPPSLTTQ